MADYLSRFTTRLKPRRDLIEKYEWSARFYGDRDIKLDLAQARRISTSLSNVTKRFNHLADDDRFRLIDAASSMSKLASDLAVLAKWAVAYYAFAQNERKIEFNKKYEALAQRRWGGDDVAMRFDRDLLQELATKDGRERFAAWMHGTGRHTDIPISKFYFDDPFSRYARETSGCSERTKVIFAIEQDEIFPGAWGDGLYVFHRDGLRTFQISRQSYEEYRQWRIEVHRLSKSAIQTASTPKPT